MPNLKFVKSLFGVVLLLSVMSCSKESIIVSENYNEKPSEAQSSLTIRTRANAEENGNAYVSYPVYVYVFDSKNKCVALETVTDQQQQLDIKLTEGVYNIYGIAGVGIERYDIPTMESASPESVIELRAGKTHGDLMVSHNNIVLSYGEKNTLTLSLKRQVMMVQHIDVSNVPENVTAVSVSLSPLYGDLSINGSFKSDNNIESISLAHADGTRTWTYDGEYFLPGASGTATISVKMTSPDGVMSYSYTCSDELEANYKINIHGVYTASTGVVLSGTITGEDWTGERTISFNFDEEGSSTSEQNPDDDENKEQSGETAPAAGTIYKGAYVLRTESQSDGSTKVTLMTATTKTGLQFTKNDQESILAAVTIAKEELIAAQEIRNGGWQLPSFDEMKYIYDARPVLMNQDIAKLEGVEQFDFNNAMFYLTEENTIFGYLVNNNIYREDLLDDKSILRLFNVLTFK